jgi:hypothetical protein
MDTDRAFVRAVAIGIGLIGFMVTWLIMNRVTERLVGQPSAAIVAMTTAFVAGVVTTIVATRRLGRSA